MDRMMYNIDMEEQYQLDLIKAIQETKDGEYILPTELSGKVTVCKNLTEAEEHISQNHL